MFWERPLVAFDIGSSSVKAAQFGKGKERKLLNLGIESLSRGAVVDGEIKDNNEVSTAILRLMNTMNIKTKRQRASISVGGGGVLIKRVQIATGSEDDLEEKISYEAQQYFQQDIEEMYFRYQKRPGGSSGDSYLLVGARREIVEQRIEIIHQVGLKVGVVDCDVLCLANMFDYNYPVADALVATINVGASSSQVILSFNGEFLYTRDILFGGNTYTERMGESLGLDFHGAEAFKIAASLGRQQIPDNATEILSTLNAELVSEVRTTLDYYLNQEGLPEGATGLNYIFLTGGGARALGLDATIAAHLNLPVQHVNPFQRVDISGSGVEPDYLASQGGIYGTAVGLALREMGDSEES